METVCEFILNYHGKDIAIQFYREYAGLGLLYVQRLANEVQHQISQVLNSTNLQTINYKKVAKNTRGINGCIYFCSKLIWRSLDRPYKLFFTDVVVVLLLSPNYCDFVYRYTLFTYKIKKIVKTIMDE